MYPGRSSREYSREYPQHVDGSCAEFNPGPPFLSQNIFSEIVRSKRVSDDDGPPHPLPREDGTLGSALQVQVGARALVQFDIELKLQGCSKRNGDVLNGVVQRSRLLELLNLRAALEAASNARTRHHLTVFS
jgi:hypothetical protein